MVVRNFSYEFFLLFHRLMKWGLPLLMLVMIWSLFKDDKHDPVQVWLPPIEPPGTVITTANTTRNDVITENSKARQSFASENNVHEAIGMDSRSVQMALDHWRKAWSLQDTPSYLESYANDFSPSKYSSREAWKQSRINRINSKKYIRVDIEQLVIHVKGKIATTSFRQVYQDDHLRMTNNKTLIWIYQRNQWKILDEQSQ